MNVAERVRRFLQDIEAISAVRDWCCGRTYARSPFSEDSDTLPRKPAWVTSGRTEAPEDVAFLSGAAPAHLHLVVGQTDIPQALYRDRLALRAAEVCVMLSGRPERAGDLRDALAFLQPGDSPGPAGETWLHWRRADARPVSVTALHRALPGRARRWLGPPRYWRLFWQSRRALTHGPDPGGCCAGAGARLEVRCAAVGGWFEAVRLAQKKGRTCGWPAIAPWSPGPPRRRRWPPIWPGGRRC